MTFKYATSLVWIALAATLSDDVAVAQVQFQSGPKQVSLLELYTSEGCSSCPAAEEWLTRLRSSASLWKEYAPVAFHVDYWDSLGWKDNWSNVTFTERQRAYAEAWRSDNIYTPCFVLNGKEWRGWSFGSSVPGSSDDAAGELAVRSADTNLWVAEFIPAKLSNTNYELHAALLAGGLNSDVKAGENKGHRLRHEFVVLNLVNSPMTGSDKVARGNFTVNLHHYPSENALAITVWVTRPGQLQPLQATGGWLESPANVR
jgi:hypothetical protein